MGLKPQLERQNRELRHRCANGGNGFLNCTSGTNAVGTTREKVMRDAQYILNRLPIGIVMLDPEHRVVSYSGEAAALFGEDHLKQTLGQPIQSTHPPQSRGKIDWLLHECREGGASGYASMLINMPERVLQLRVVHMADGGGTHGYCLMLYDITHLTSQGAPAQGRPAQEGDNTTPSRDLYKLPVSLQGRIALLDIEEVGFLRADGHYTEVCSGGKHYFCNLSLSQLESRLPKERFVRVHRSYIVNLAHASAVRRNDDQLAISIAGNCDHEIPVSRANVPRLRSLLGV